MESTMEFIANRVNGIKWSIAILSIWLILPLIAFPVALVQKRYEDVYIGLSIYLPLCIVAITQFILLRKYYLGKAFLNESGAGYKYKNTTYKFFKWEEIIKIKVYQSSFRFYIAEKENRGKNLIEIKFPLSYKNHIEVIDTCKAICKLIKIKQKEYNFEIESNEKIKQLLDL